MPMQECIFCKIAKKVITTDLVKETDDFVVFKDIHPSAPMHFLIVPKDHITDMHSASDALWVKIKEIALKLEKENNLGGFRLATNAGDKADVKHFHVHFLAGFNKNKKV
jgi:histidine triad (HIT) family protein